MRRHARGHVVLEMRRRGPEGGDGARDARYRAGIDGGGDGRDEKENVRRIDLEEAAPRERLHVDRSRAVPLVQEEPENQVAAEGEEHVDAGPAASCPRVEKRMSPGAGR